MGGATYLHKRGVYGASACNVRSNVSLRLLKEFSIGDPGTFWLILHRLETSHVFQQESKKAILGNGRLTSKTVVCTIWLVLPWMVTYYGVVCVLENFMKDINKLEEVRLHLYDIHDCVIIIKIILWCMKSCTCSHTSVYINTLWHVLYLGCWCNIYDQWDQYCHSL